MTPIESLESMFSQWITVSEGHIFIAEACCNILRSEVDPIIQYIVLDKDEQRGIVRLKNGKCLDIPHSVMADREALYDWMRAATRLLK